MVRHLKHIKKYFPHQDLYVILPHLKPTEVKHWGLCFDQAVAFQFGIDFYERGKTLVKCNKLFAENTKEKMQVFHIRKEVFHM